MESNYQGEQWKAVFIEGISDDEKYEISNFGRLKRQKPTEQGLIIIPSKIKGYPIVNLKLKTEKRTTRYIHKLVAEAFIQKEDDLQEYVLHVDFNKENNHFKNLIWATRAELFEHQSKNPNYKKGLVRYSKLTETDVIRLKKRLMRGKNPLYKIAKEFGITHTQLNRIRSGENWGHIKVE